MSRVALLVFVATLFLHPRALLAGDSVSVRMVAVSQEEAMVDEGLADVQEFLAANLPYKRYVLLDSQKAELPAAAKLKMARGYTVQLQGPQENLIIKVAHKRKLLLKSTLTLQENKPLIVGVLPSAEGQLIFVLIVK